MIRAITIVGFLSLCVVFNLYAHDSDRIDQLGIETQELNLRISEVESLLNNPSTAQKVVKTSEGWKSVVNWRKLSRGMDYGDVRKILGEPQRIDGGYLEKWHYPNYGRVVFADGNVDGWREPQE